MIPEWQLSPYRQTVNDITVATDRISSTVKTRPALFWRTRMWWRCARISIVCHRAMGTCLGPDDLIDTRKRITTKRIVSLRSTTSGESEVRPYSFDVPVSVLLSRSPDIPTMQNGDDHHLSGRCGGDQLLYVGQSPHTVLTGSVPIALYSRRELQRSGSSP